MSDIFELILESTMPTYRELVDDSGKRLDELCALSVCVERECVTCVLALDRREEFLASMNDCDPALAAELRKIHTLRADGMLRVVVMSVEGGVGRVHSGRVSLSEEPLS